MHLYNLLSLISSACAGATMGSFLLLTVIHKPVLSNQLKAVSLSRIYARFYRLNGALCLVGGLMAALLNNRQAALLFAIIAVSYVFNNMHLLKGINAQLQGDTGSRQQGNLGSLYLLQNSMHFLQFLGSAWVVYLLN